MKEGWKIKVLGDVCTFENGDRGENYPSKSIQTTSGIPFINAGHLTESGLDFESMNYIPKERFNLLSNGKICRDDILFCLRGSLGKFATVGELSEGAIASSLVIVRGKEAVLNKYLIAYFQSDLCAEMINKFKNGAAQPNLSAANLKSFIIPIAPLPEQQRIVAILDEAFESIAIAKANAEKNLQNAKALFESYLQGVFSQVGEGWKTKTLGDTSILKIIDGDRGSNYPSKEDFSDDGFCLFLNTKNVRPDGFNFDTTMFVSEEKDKSLRKGKLQRQDVILTTRGTIGNVAIFDESVEFENIRINSGMLIFRVNQKELLPSFLYEVFRSGIMKEQMTRHVSGAAQPQLPIKTLINFEIPIPNSLATQGKIVDGVRTINHETQRLESLYQQKITALDELKKALLHQAFSGQL